MSNVDLVILLLGLVGIVLAWRMRRHTIAWTQSPKRPSAVLTFLEITVVMCALLFGVERLTDPTGGWRGGDLVSNFIVVLSVVAGFGTVFSLWFLRSMWRRFVERPSEDPTRPPERRNDGPPVPRE